MKTKYIFIALCLMCTTPLMAQEKIFEKYADMENVTSVYISKAMFEMMPSIQTAGLSLMNLKGKVESLQALRTDREDRKKQMRHEFKEYMFYVQHEELMRVRSDSTNTTFYVNKKGDRIKDLIMLSESGPTFTVIQVLGDFTLQDVQQVADEMQKK